MFHFAKAALVLGASIFVGGAVGAAVIPYTVTTSNPSAITGSLSLLSDGYIPPNETRYDDPTVLHFNDPSVTFTFDFGGTVTIGNVLANVDNNDDYIFTFFNGATQVAQRTILASDGTVSQSDGGVETFTGDPTNAIYTQEPSLGFGMAGLVATSVQLSIGTNDAALGVGEVRFNTPTRLVGRVPEPASWAMMVVGFGALGAALRRRPTVRLA